MCKHSGRVELCPLLEEGIHTATDGQISIAGPFAEAELDSPEYIAMCHNGALFVSESGVDELGATTYRIRAVKLIKRVGVSRRVERVGHLTSSLHLSGTCHAPHSPFRGDTLHSHVLKVERMMVDFTHLL